MTLTPIPPRPQPLRSPCPLPCGSLVPVQMSMHGTILPARTLRAHGPGFRPLACASVPAARPSPGPAGAHSFHCPRRRLASPDQAQAVPHASPSPALAHTSPSPALQAHTSSSPALTHTDQPEPSPSPHQPSHQSEPSPAHGSQHATQPSLHSQPTAQPEYSSQPTAQAQPPSPACALNPQPSTAQPPPRSPQPKLGPAQPSPRSPHWIIDSPFSQVLPLVAQCLP